MRLPIFQRLKGAPKSKITYRLLVNAPASSSPARGPDGGPSLTHYIKSVPFQPVRDVDALPRPLLHLGDELVCVFENTRVVRAKRLGRKGQVPAVTPPPVVLGPVAQLHQIEQRISNVVPWMYEVLGMSTI